MAAIVFSGVTLLLGIRLETNPGFRDPIFGAKVTKLMTAMRDLKCETPIIFFGSSRVDNGFRATDAEAQLNARIDRPIVTMNFAFAGAGPLLITCYTDRLTSNGIRPKAICVEIVPSFLQDHDGAPAETKWITPDRFTKREREQWNQLSHGAVPQWLTVSNNPWEHGKAPSLYLIAPWMNTTQKRQIMEQITDARGWNSHLFVTQTTEGQAKGFENARKDHGNALANLRFDSPAANAVRKFLTKHSQTPIHLVLMPESTNFATLYGPGSNDRLMAFMRSLNVPFTDARDWVPDHEFADGHHLLPGGASIFTERFTREVLIPWQGRP